MSKTKETAPQAYAKAQVQIDALLKVIQDRADLVGDCQKANWAHVGTLAHIRESLADVAVGLALAEAGNDETEARNIVDLQVETLIKEGK